MYPLPDNGEKSRPTMLDQGHESHSPKLQHNFELIRTSSTEHRRYGECQALHLNRIESKEDLTNYLEACCMQEPSYQGYGCKDISTFGFIENFRRRYFVLYCGLLLYYKHKSNFDKDRKHGLVCSIKTTRKEYQLLVSFSSQKKATAIILENLYLTKPSLPCSPHCKFSFYLNTSHKLNKRQ